jgi:hypothetical protein
VAVAVAIVATPLDSTEADYIAPATTTERRDAEVAPLHTKGGHL